MRLSISLAPLVEPSTSATMTEKVSLFCALSCFKSQRKFIVSWKESGDDESLTLRHDFVSGVRGQIQAVSTVFLSPLVVSSELALSQEASVPPVALTDAKHSLVSSYTYR